MSCRKLPDRRKSFTWKVRIGGTAVYVTVGLYDDGSPGELFLNIGKGDLKNWSSDWAVLFSSAIQYGVPLEKLLTKFLLVDTNPQGQVNGHPFITQCTSIVSFVVRALAIEFLGRMDLADVQPVVINEKVAGVVSTGSGW